MPAHTKSLELDPFPAAMQKLANDAVDNEICRKLRDLIATNEIDMDPALLDSMIRTPRDVKHDTVPKELLPFFRHYLFLLRRQKTRK